MSFASIQFAVFLVLVFAAYYLRPRVRWQNLVCVFASYYFYGWWDVRFCALLFASSAIDYWIGGAIARSAHRWTRRLLLWLSIGTNLGLLGFFKYCNFFIESLVSGLSEAGVTVNLSSLNIILPVGISFYTFQTLSYTIDIYRGRHTPERNFVAYLAFVSFFPQLVAGPIERASNLLPQFHRERQFSYGKGVTGCQLMLWGLFKKVAVADNLAVVVDSAYANPSSAGAPLLAFATVCFAFQIYCDFSGYSDIATGVARLFGIRLRRNFAVPYFSRDLSEFWRRWHISLSGWFRDYVFVPLGGSRSARGRRLANVAAVFLLSGLWHGAAWTFVVWGALHALMLFPRHWRELGYVGGGSSVNLAAASISRVYSGCQMLRTFTLVCAGWVLFRADGLESAMAIYQSIFTGLISIEFYGEIVRTIGEWPRAFVVLAIVFAIDLLSRGGWNPLALRRAPRAARFAVYTVIFWSILYLGPARVQPFIYFQF